MPPVTVIILHPEPGPDTGPLERLLGEVRRTRAEALRAAFATLGADEVRVVSGPPDDVTFGRRLGAAVDRARPGGLVILGSGAVPLATPTDLAAFLDVARTDDRTALANNRYSADIVAIASAAALPAIPDLPGDNALPRWLEERAGWSVGDLRGRWRLQVDLDSPLDLLLTGQGAGGWATPALERLEAVRDALGDRRAEVVVAGRTSAGTLAWLERHAAARTRAIVEERGLRASSPLAMAPLPTDANPRADDLLAGTSRPRPPRSVLGLLLDETGPDALGRILAELGDAAVVDSRVLLAHRLGADERAWPSAEDRFASDLLSPASIADPWLRTLTAAAADASIPVLLGGHALVGPGIRLLTTPRRRRRRTG
jgi:hypothetical protein